MDRGDTMETPSKPVAGTYDYYMALSEKWAGKAAKHSANPKLAKADLAMATYNYDLAIAARAAK